MRTSERRLGLLLLAAAGGTNIPTPLLLLYRSGLDMSSTSVTALFGVYALGLMPAVALAGPAADVWGRRRVALPAALFCALTSLLFVGAAHSEPMLFLVRFLQGAGAGAVFTVASAWTVESAAREGSTSGPRTAAVTMTGGFAIGPTVAGLVGQWGPWPLVLPYLLHACAVVAAVAVAWGVAETLAPRSTSSTGPGDVVRAPAFRPGRLVPAVVVVAPLAVCVYAFPASAVAGVPVLVGFPVAPVALTGLLAGMTLGAGSLAAPLQGRLGRRTAPVAAACGAVGYAVTAVAAAVPALLLLAVPAAIVLGAGGGLALAAGLARLPELASAGRLGSVSAAFYACAYLGFGVPLLLAALTATVAGVAVWLAVLAALCALLVVAQARARL